MPEFNKASIPEGIYMHDRTDLQSWGFFHVGGQYIKDEAIGGQIMQGQMYVEVFAPTAIQKRYPIVLIHGNCQNGLGWMGTPAGGDGWVDYLLKEGYLVYVVDAPTRGRASYFLNHQAQTLFPADGCSLYFAGAGNPKHTQFPGTGELGDPAFDAFYASQNTSLCDQVYMQVLVRDAACKLLDRIGPAILVTHSQSGPTGWLIADACPNLVKGIVALEPYGPSFTEPAAAFGITGVPLTYDRPVTLPSDIEKEEIFPKNEREKPGFIQKEPARQLTNLARIPILIVTGSASYHVPYDHLTAAYLRQAGVENTHIYLEDEGIIGNGHMMMLEENNQEIAARIDRWLDQKIGLK